MATESLIGYFGYGSLVNRKTLRTAYSDAICGELSGFRREWRIRGDSPQGPVCALTAAHDAGSLIQGLLVIDKAENLAQVDEREARYDRVAISIETLSLERDVEIGALYVYVAKPAHTGAADPRYPIWQSYVDAVMQGYLTEFGRAGLERFVAETQGWDQTILPDRHAPKYPRAVDLSDEERGLFDALLGERRGPGPSETP